jgi:transcriptional regulator GlxA family with amidase domain
MAQGAPVDTRCDIASATEENTMDRRNFIATSAGLLASGTLVGHARGTGLSAPSAPAAAAAPAAPLEPPAKGRIRVAVALAESATVIDFCGPWEVFQDVMLPGDDMPFELYTVARSRDPVRATGGLHINPDFSVNDAPAPHVIVVPALRGNDALSAWIEASSRSTQLTMSVCTGAFQLARVGLLDGLTATTHHDFYDRFAEEFPKVTLVQGTRYVEHDRVATAGGLTSGIDLALRVVQRYYGTEVARRTAEYMEHASERWMNPV